MRRVKPHVLSLAASAAALVACQATFTLVNRPCPCADDFVCCESTQICVSAADKTTCESATLDAGNDATNPNDVLDAGYDADAEPPLLAPPGTLVRLDTEPAGPHCPVGGRALRRGRDLDGDKALEDNEYTSTTYVCSPTTGKTLTGDFTIKNSLDVDALAGVTKITGDLTIDVSKFPALSLRELVEVGGSLVIKAGVEDLSFPALTGVGSHLELKATTASFPSLVYVAEYFNVSTTELGTLSAPKLVTAKWFTLQETPKLTSLTLTSLTGHLRILEVYNSGLTHLDAFRGVSDFEEIRAQFNASLVDLDGVGQAKTTTALLVNDNPMLASLHGLEALSEVGTLTIDKNPKLTDISALSGLTKVGEDFTLVATPTEAPASFPAVTKATSIVFAAAPGSTVSALAFPNLVSVTEDFRIEGLNGLTNIELPKLTTSPVVSIVSASLSSVALPEATSFGQLSLGGDALTSVEAPKLVSSAVGITAAPKLTTLSLPKLTSAGYLIVANTGLTSLAGLAKLEVIASIAPAAYPAELGIRANPSLTSLGLAALDQVQVAFNVEDNAALETCPVKALRASLSAPPPQITSIARNKNPNATCN